MTVVDVPHAMAVDALKKAGNTVKLVNSNIILHKFIEFLFWAFIYFSGIIIHFFFFFFFFLPLLLLLFISFVYKFTWKNLLISVTLAKFYHRVFVFWFEEKYDWCWSRGKRSEDIPQNFSSLCIISNNSGYQKTERKVKIDV